MSALDEIVNYTNGLNWVPYYSRAGDVNRNGIPDRADLYDGNGVDCSGWVWLVLAHLAQQGWFHGLPYLPLGTTSTYADYARDHGWIRANNRYGLGFMQAVPGDVLIHSSNNGDVYHSDGPDGHTGILVEKQRDGAWTTSESASSKSGVGFYERAPGWWHMAVALPGMNGTPQSTPGIPGDDDMFDPNTDGRKLEDIHRSIDQTRQIANALAILMAVVGSIAAKEEVEAKLIADLHQSLPQLRAIAAAVDV